MHHERRDHDRHVDPEDGAPADAVDQHAAQDRAQRQATVPTIEPNTPIALARSAGSVKVAATIAIATGLSMVPPTACSARAAIRKPMLGATAHSNEPAPNATSPTRKTLRRPTRSAVEPASTRKPASTRV